jgi:hypothetical protein
MKQKLEGGNTNTLLMIMIVILTTFMIMSPRDFPDSSGKQNSDQTSGSSKSETISQGNSYSETTFSSSDISIGTGNASNAYQPYEEYITLYNRGETNVDITGWKLKNGKDKRPHYLGSTLQRFSADLAIIPQGTEYLYPVGASPLKNIVLKSGEEAIITTGRVGAQSPYSIVSFKENMCSGYIENLSDYTFNPSLSQDCPDPTLEPGIQNLDTKCQEFIEDNIDSCHTPEFDGRNDKGERCSNCIDGIQVTSSCYNFIKEHFSYQGCVAHHASDPDFSLDTWRIFLGRGWEMWAEDHETIELYDRAGQLVDFENY